MRCFVALGSNSDQARGHLEAGAALLKQHPQITQLRFSTLFTTPALLPKGAPANWNKVFLNGACQLDWGGSNPYELLDLLKSIEQKCGLRKAERWSPRALDLDLLVFGDTVLNEERLKLPHPEIAKRSFVLDPLAELAPALVIPGANKTVLELRRALRNRAPSFMGVVNLTPDSFSDGGVNWEAETFQAQMQMALAAGVQYLDLGAESTRPGAQELRADEEWARLTPFLATISELKKDSVFFPKISIDTYKPEVAVRALEWGAEIINDVGAGRDDKMLELVAESGCDYICMHSLAVPADKTVHWPVEAEPISLLMDWVIPSLKRFEKHGISLEKVTIDPGIGFGKTAQQSLQLLQGIEEVLKLPVRVLIGHSRKSFMNLFSSQPSSERNPESLGISMRLGLQGVEVLRVHDAHLHQRSWIACHHLSPQHAE